MRMIDVYGPLRNSETALRRISQLSLSVALLAEEEWDEAQAQSSCVAAKVLACASLDHWPIPCRVCHSRYKHAAIRFEPLVSA